MKTPEIFRNWDYSYNEINKWHIYDRGQVRFVNYRHIPHKINGWRWEIWGKDNTLIAKSSQPNQSLKQALTCFNEVMHIIATTIFDCEEMEV